MGGLRNRQLIYLLGTFYFVVALLEFGSYYRPSTYIKFDGPRYVGR